MSAQTPPGTVDPPEGTPASTDGEPDADELERRRRTRAGTSVSDRAAGSEPQSEDELFPEGSLEGDPKVTLKSLIKAGSRVRVVASFSKAEVPIKNGALFDPEREITFLVRGLPGGVTPRPKHEGKSGDQRRPIKEWTLSQSIRAIHVENAGEMFSRVQVLEMLHEAGVPSATVSKLLGDDPQAVEA
jgi:hypothetical protein